MEFLKLIYYGLLVLSLVTLLATLKRLPSYCKWFVPLICLGLAVQAASEILEACGTNSYFLFHLYQPMECMALLGFYHQILSSRTKWVSILFSVAYPIILVIHYWQSPRSFTTWDFFDFTTEAFIVCVFVILFFLQLLANRNKTDLRRFTAFWLNAAHLIFYGGCLFVMGFYFYIKTNDPSLARSMLSINHFLNLFLYLAYTLIFAWTATPTK